MGRQSSWWEVDPAACPALTSENPGLIPGQEDISRPQGPPSWYVPGAVAATPAFPLPCLPQPKGVLCACTTKGKGNGQGWAPA